VTLGARHPVEIGDVEDAHGDPPLQLGAA
jgi:hypothetical protein